MRKNYFLIFMLFLFQSSMGQSIWTGANSLMFNDPLNWSPNGVPSTSATIVLNNPGANYPLTLDANRTVSALNMTTGAVNLNGFDLLTTTTTITAGSLANGLLRAINFSDVSNAVFVNMVVRKNGGGTNNDLTGNNSFTNCTIVNASGNRFRFANINGDFFYGSLDIERVAGGNLQLAFSDTTFFNCPIVLIGSTTSNSLSFGLGGGHSIMAAGNHVDGSALTAADLRFENFTQLGSVANVSFNSTTLTFVNASFGGDVTINASGSSTVTINNSIFARTNNITARNILMSASQFSTSDGLTNIIKTGGTADEMAGGNTFNNLTYTVNTNQPVRFAMINGDTFLGNTVFNRNGTAFFEFARSGSNFFAGNVEINTNSASNLIRTGFTGGTTTIAAGGAIKTSGFAGAGLTLINVTQLGATANDSFSTATSVFRNCIIGGDFAVNSISNTITIDSCNFLRNVFFEGTQILMPTGSTFSTLGGNTTINKIGANNDFWFGGNTFGGPTLITNSGGGVLRLAASVGDAFLSSVKFIKNSGATFDIAYQGISTFGGQITINSTNSSNRIRFGELGGISNLGVGASLQTDSFVNAGLTLRNFNQTAAISNATFNCNGLTISNALFNGSTNFEMNGTATLTLINSEFTSTNEFTYANSAVTDGCTFSNISGTTTFHKNGGSADNWEGNNTFGNVVFNNNSTVGMRTANSGGGDTFLGTVIANKNNTGTIELAFSGNNTFAANITLNTNTTGTMRIGSSGSVIIASGAAILNGGFTASALVLANVTQLGSAPNGSFDVSNFTATNGSLGGNIVVNAAGDITITNQDFLANATFTYNNAVVSGGCNFSTVSGVATFTKNGGTEDLWAGNNSFGNLILNNNTTVRMRTANTGGGDNYLGLVTANKNNTGGIELAFSGNNSFAGNVFLNTSSTGTMRIGSSGTVSMASGSSLRTSGFSNSSLIVNNFTQLGSVANDLFNVQNFTITNSNVGGSFSINAAADVTITASAFATNVTFTYNNASVSGACNFSTASGVATFTKNFGTDDLWTGGNTFGNLVLNNAGSSVMRLANTGGGDVFNGTVTVNKNFTGAIQLAFSGINAFNGNITLNNALSGEVRIGSGTSTMAVGTSINTSGFSAGTLTINNLVQTGSSSNGTFSPATLNLSGTTLGGAISFSVLNTATIANTAFQRSVNLTAASLAVSGSNQFSTISGTATITKSGTTDNDWSSGQTFGNAIITNNSTSRLRLASTGVGDNFTGNVTFVRNNTGLLQVAHAGTSNFEGNISTAGTGLINFCENTGFVSISGDAPQVFNTNPALVPVVRRLIMNTTDSLTLAGPIEVSISLTLNNGIINTSNSNYLRVNNVAATSPIGTPSSHINGPMEYTMATNATSRSTLNFPISDNGEIRQIVLEVSHTVTTSYTYRAQVVNSSAAALGFTRPLTIDKVSGVRYWVIERFQTAGMIPTPSAGLRTTLAARPQINLYYDMDDQVTDPAFLTILKTDETNPNQWYDIGGTGATITSGTITSTSTPTVFSSFSIFTLGNRIGGNNPLPITLINFTAKENFDNVLLEWQTANETNNDFFTIEKSDNGENWTEVTKVQGAGNSQDLLSYQAFDANPFVGTSFYRLKQTDFDGTFTYSPVVRVFFSNGDQKQTVQVFPVPSNDRVFISGIKADESAAITVFSALGQQVSNQVAVTRHSDNRIELHINKLATGIYFLQVKDDVIKFIKSN